MGFGLVGDAMLWLGAGPVVEEDGGLVLFLRGGPCMNHGTRYLQFQAIMEQFVVFLGLHEANT